MYDEREKNEREEMENDGDSVVSVSPSVTVRFSPRKRRRIVRSDDDDVDYNDTIKPCAQNVSDKKRAASGTRVEGRVDDDERGKARCSEHTRKQL